MLILGIKATFLARLSHFSLTSRVSQSIAFTTTFASTVTITLFSIHPFELNKLKQLNNVNTRQFDHDILLTYNEPEKSHSHHTENVVTLVTSFAQNTALTVQYYRVQYKIQYYRYGKESSVMDGVQQLHENRAKK